MAKQKNPDRVKIWAIDDNEKLIRKFGGYRSLNKWLDNNPEFHQILIRYNNGSTHIIMERTFIEDEDGNDIERTICYSDKVNF